VHRPEETHRQRLGDQPRATMLLRVVARCPGVVTPVGALVQKMRAWAGKEGDRSHNGLNHQPPAALASDSQSGRPPCPTSSWQCITRSDEVSSFKKSSTALGLFSWRRRFLTLDSPTHTRFLPPRPHLYRQRRH